MSRGVHGAPEKLRRVKQRKQRRQPHARHGQRYSEGSGMCRCHIGDRIARAKRPCHQSRVWKPSFSEGSLTNIYGPLVSCRVISIACAHGRPEDTSSSLFGRSSSESVLGLNCCKMGSFAQIWTAVDPIGTTRRALELAKPRIVRKSHQIWRARACGKPENCDVSAPAWPVEGPGGNVA